MTPQERYTATLALLDERTALCEKMLTKPWPTAHSLWRKVPVSSEMADLMVLHDPDTMLRVYRAAKETMLNHRRTTYRPWCFEHRTWPCPDALRVMNTWLPDE